MSTTYIKSTTKTETAKRMTGYLVEGALLGFGLAAGELAFMVLMHGTGLGAIRIAMTHQAAATTRPKA